MLYYQIDCMQLLLSLIGIYIANTNYKGVMLQSNKGCEDTIKHCKHYTQYCETHKGSLKGKCDKTCEYCGPKVCKDKRNDCKRLLHYCPGLKGQCAKSCGYCESEEPKCEDARIDCSNMKQYCKTHEMYMKNLCRMTCGYCIQCENKLTQKHCLSLKKKDKCQADLRMQDYCTNTCGFCSLPNPEKCWKTQYGCCWDKVTTKKTPSGRDCPPCIDRFRFLCKTLKKACISSSFVRKNCQRSCDYCPVKGAKCSDDPEKIHLCRFWKEKLGFCEMNPDIMRHYCPVSCNFDCMNSDSRGSYFSVP